MKLDQLQRLFGVGTKTMNIYGRWNGKLEGRNVQSTILVFARMFYIYGLFNDAVNSSDCFVSNGSMISNE
jgi:hypothetical protein